MLTDYKEKKSSDHITIKIRKKKDVTINDREINYLLSQSIRGLFKIKKNSGFYIEYEAPLCVSLYNYLKNKNLTKQEFLMIINQLYSIEGSVLKNNLVPGKIIYDINHVYYNEFSKEIFVLYYPSDRTSHVGSAETLIEDIVNNCRADDSIDMDYILKFSHFLRELNDERRNKINSFIGKGDGSDTVRRGAIRKGDSGKLAGTADDATDIMRNVSVPEDDPVLDDFSIMDEPTGIMADKEGAKKKSALEKKISSGLEERIRFADSNSDGQNDKTGVLISNEYNIMNDFAPEPPKKFPRLYRVSTKEFITINEPVFRVGKEKAYVNYYVDGNGAVSRNHIDIIVRGSRFFVIDLNSKNRTFINNCVIPVRQETEIFDGDKLKLANEEFVFYA